MLAEKIDAFIGVDTHTDTHSACLVTPLGSELANITIPATGADYLQLLEWATEHTPGPRLAWAVKGTPQPRNRPQQAPHQQLTDRHAR